MAIAEGVLAADASDPSPTRNSSTKMMALFETCLPGYYRPAHRPRGENAEHIEARVSRFANYIGVKDETALPTRTSTGCGATREALAACPLGKDEANLQPMIDQLLESPNGSASNGYQLKRCIATGQAACSANISAARLFSSEKSSAWMPPVMNRHRSPAAPRPTVRAPSPTASTHLSHGLAAQPRCGGIG
jgi:hypothetical protein